MLITQAREGNKLRGYSFCTLERIGGTPSLLVGLALVDRTSRAESALKGIMADQYRRALLAFPDEDVSPRHRTAVARGVPGLLGPPQHHALPEHGDEKAAFGSAASRSASVREQAGTTGPSS